MAAWTETTRAKTKDSIRTGSLGDPHTEYQRAGNKRIKSRRVGQTEDDLVLSCLDGSERAWEEMVRRYSRLIYSVTRRYGVAASDSEDICQNVFIKAFRYLSNLRDPSRLSAWLIATTHHECLTFEARSTSHEELEDDLSDADASPLEHVYQGELQQLVRQAVGELDGQSQRLLTALFFETASPSYRDIADRLGIPTGSIGPMRARSLKKLKEILAASGPDLDG